MAGHVCPWWGGYFIDEIHQCLRPRGKLLVVEPLGHVPAKRFESMLLLASETGFEILERPRVRLSRAVVLVKGQAAENC
jgi:hypothetical protein